MNCRQQHYIASCIRKETQLKWTLANAKLPGLQCGGRKKSKVHTVPVPKESTVPASNEISVFYTSHHA